eukprot:NODE_1686_length_1084_cov_53.676385.p1 GENE.NODE_1686_length_1084_cov_53.676385~~NODE_1686_length_1084_cov_53.676385.p1  ORF type:complete len:335 (+),score=120.75 NODE_1686_length_1084_cov_53.676385:89-1006(+)
MVLGDNFVKVHGLISDLIGVLEAEATNEEDVIKPYCDQLQTWAGKRDDAVAQMESLASEKETHRIDIELRQREIAEKQKAIADNLKELEQAKILRKEENENNEKVKFEMKTGKEAVLQAISVLKKVFSFVQTESWHSGGRHHETPEEYRHPGSGRDGKTVGDVVPETFSDEDYNGHQGYSNVIDLLDEIVADFTRAYEAADAEEKDRADKFDDFENDIAKDNDEKEGEIDGAKDKVDGLESDLFDIGTQFKAEDVLHKGALEEIEDMKPKCIDRETFAKRKAQREKEIDGLEEALSILDACRTKQ